MEVGEGVAVPPVDVVDEDKCPFCNKEPVGHATKKPEDVNDEVKSVPSALKCDASSWRGASGAHRSSGDRPYTLAQHHLISAIQCYAQVRRLVRMGNMVGYDINNPKNGIGLPTTHWRLKYPQGGEKVKYGDLSDDGKQSVAFALMRELGAQWHVGHHAFDVSVSQAALDSWQEKGADELDQDDVPHEVSYDALIIGRLLQLLKSFPEEMCTDEDRDSKFKSGMDELSEDIKSHLSKFNGSDGAKPGDSSPLFVSMQAYRFAEASAEPMNADLPVDSGNYG